MDYLDLADEVKSYISSKIENEIKYVIPVRQIPKTTSGKNKDKLVENFLRGDYKDYVQAYIKHIHADTDGYLLKTPVNEYEDKIRQYFQDHFSN